MKQSPKDILFLISGILKWLFSTKLGIFALLLPVLLFIFLKIWNSIRSRKLACQAASKPFRFAEGLGIFFNELYSVILGIVSVFPVIVAVLAIGISIIAISDTVEELDKIRKDAIRIRELSVVLKNMESRYRLMSIEIKKAEYDRTDMLISFYDYSGKVLEKQELSIIGNDIYIDSIICNFDYAEIAEGRRINLAIPYSIFSDRIAQKDGISLASMDKNGVPWQYHRMDADIYGIAPDAYRERLQELMQIINDEKLARLNGIVRSIYGSAVHKKVKSGERFTIWVEQSGGLTIKESGSF